MGTAVERRKFQGRGEVHANDGLYSRGMPVMGSGPVSMLFKGNVYHVDSGHANASDSNEGSDPTRPLATLDAAVAKCTASNGDVILVSEGHAETIAGAAGVNLDMAGITVIGLGNGPTRPTFSLSAVASTIAVAAAGVRLVNLVFEADAANTVMLDVNDNDCTVEGCEFREGDDQAVTYIDVNGGGANVCDNFRLLHSIIYSPTAGSTQAVEIGAVQNRVQLIGNVIQGDFSVAGVHSASICTNMLIEGNVIGNDNAGDWAIELTGAATGLLIGNRFYANAAATTLDPGSLKCVDNFMVNAIDQSSAAVPTTATAAFPVGSINAATFAAGAIDAAAIAAGAIDAGAFAADAIDSAALSSGAITAATFAAGAIDAAAIAAGAIDAGAFAADAIDSTVLASGAITAATFAADAIDSAALSSGAIVAATFAAGAIDAAAIADSAIDANTFAAGAITAAAFAADAVDSTVLASGAITAATFAAGAIDAAAIAAGAIDAGAFAADAIDATALSSGAITADTLAADTLTNAKIADDTLSDEQFDADAVAKLALGGVVDRATQVLPQSASLTLFTVAGGHVALPNVFGLTTVAHDANANSIKLLATPTSGPETDLCVAASVSGRVVGTLAGITGTLGDTLQLGGVVPVQDKAVIVPPGTIRLNASATGAGSMAWQARWFPLDTGATLVATTT